MKMHVWIEQQSLVRAGCTLGKHAKSFLPNALLCSWFSFWALEPTRQAPSHRICSNTLEEGSWPLKLVNDFIKSQENRARNGQNMFHVLFMLLKPSSDPTLTSFVLIDCKPPHKRNNSPLLFHKMSSVRKPVLEISLLSWSQILIVFFWTLNVEETVGNRTKRFLQKT